MPRKPDVELLTTPTTTSAVVHHRRAQVQRRHPWRQAAVITTAPASNPARNAYGRVITVITAPKRWPFAKKVAVGIAVWAALAPAGILVGRTSGWTILAYIAAAVALLKLLAFLLAKLVDALMPGGGSAGGGGGGCPGIHCAGCAHH